MVSDIGIATEADRLLYESMTNADLSSFAHHMMTVLGACRRSAPFETSGVVARVCFLSTLAIFASSTGNHESSVDAALALQRFARKKMDWPEFQRSCAALQKELQLSDVFCHDALSFFRRHADFFMPFLKRVPGDVDLRAHDGLPPKGRDKLPPLFLSLQEG